MEYEMPPDPVEIEWKIGAEGRAWEAGEAHSRYYLAPHKTELIYGKLYCAETQRLTVLGLLLENCGAAAVRTGDPEIWRQAVAALSDPEANFRYALLSALRRRDDLSENDPDGALRFYEQVTTDDYVEEDRSQNLPRTKTRAEFVAQWRDEDSERGYAHPKSVLVRYETGSDEGTALIRETTRRYRYMTISENVRQGLPPTDETALWRELWLLMPGGWRLRRRECRERFETPA